MNRRSVSALPVLALALSLLAAGAASAAPVPAPGISSARHATAAEAGIELPRPAGPYAVGTQTLHLTDRTRRDPWVPSADRELMVSVHYPARPGRGTPAAYMTEEEARLLLEARGLGGIVPATTVSTTRTHARTDARPATGRFPLLLLSSGFSMPRGTLTSLADDLASRGYVVAAVDHAYESVGTEFPGGRVLTCLACEQVGTDQEQARATAGRAADLSFVIDQLTGRQGPARTVRGRPSLPYALIIDPKRIGAAGHSIGGASAAALMARDARVRAGVNLDGNFFAPLPAGGLGGRPFLMMGADAMHGPTGEESDWPAAWARLDGWKRWLTVTGAEHFTFTDMPVLADQLGLADPAAPLSGQRSWQLTRDYVTAFFDTQLRGITNPLIDGPTADRPEITFQRP
ncbi:alpha/beta hydrolase [Streptomyces sp. NPDC091267]|uniref:alpha/beta hydrolase family protein n=1 Tax=Streptomyces sp. NPDC091267 TaxID=3155195 RepID=UPI003415D469